MQGKGWLPVCDLRQGDRLVDPKGSDVEAVVVVATGETTTVYNFNVDELCNYHARADRTWLRVHNSCTNNLHSGNSTSAALGTRIHNGPEWQERLDSLGCSRGYEVTPGNIPDGITESGMPIELKPNTRSGIRAGTRQLRRYMREMGVDGGQLWTYHDTPDVVAFEFKAAPKQTSRFWTRF